MNKELVGCCFCEAVFERDFVTHTSPNPMQTIAVCDVCIRRKDLQEKTTELLQSLESTAKRDQK